MGLTGGLLRNEDVIEHASTFFGAFKAWVESSDDDRDGCAMRALTASQQLSGAIDRLLADRERVLE